MFSSVLFIISVQLKLILILWFCYKDKKKPAREISISQVNSTTPLKRKQVCFLHYFLENVKTIK